MRAAARTIAAARPFVFGQGHRMEIMMTDQTKPLPAKSHQDPPAHVEQLMDEAGLANERDNPGELRDGPANTGVAPPGKRPLPKG